MAKLFYIPDEARFGDFSLLVHDERLFCIYIENDRDPISQRNGVSVGSRFAVATSEDGLSWRRHGAVMKPDAPWKGRSLWAPALFRHNEGFGLLYSAIANGEDPLASQQAGYAWSRDLLSWQDHPSNPILPSSLAPPHYLDRQQPHLCWRDPNPIRVGDRWICTLAARDAGLPVEVAGCVALLESADLVSWRTCPPLFSPARYPELETPSVTELDGRWYLLFGHYRLGHCMAWASADTVTGVYHEPVGNVLTPSWCYAGRIIEHAGIRSFYHWIRDPIVGRPRTLLAPPKRLTTRGEHLELSMHPAVRRACTPVSLNSLCHELTRNAASPPLLARFPLGTTPLVLSFSSSIPGYTRAITLGKTAAGLTVHDLAPGDGVFDMRTLPWSGESPDDVSILLEEGVVEVYVQERFVHALCLPIDPAGATVSLEIHD